MTNDPSVAGLVLAAGAGTRYGGAKALVPFGDELLVERAVRVLREGRCEPVVVVLGARADAVRAAVDLPDTVFASDWESGMGASLCAGLAELERRDLPACVVALVDQPLVGPGAVARLAAAWSSGAVAAVATYEGRPRNPVLLDRRTWAGVAEHATGDTGARAWLRRHPELVTDVPCDGTGSPLDIDTPDDLTTLLEMTQ